MKEEAYLHANPFHDPDPSPLKLGECFSAAQGLCAPPLEPPLIIHDNGLPVTIVSNRESAFYYLQYLLIFHLGFFEAPFTEETTTTTTTTLEWFLK